MKKFREYLKLDEGVNKDNINEAIEAKKVYDYYIDTFKKIESKAKHYAEDNKHLDKINRRILSDYANDSDALKKIFKQLKNISNIFDVETEDLHKFIS